MGLPVHRVCLDKRVHQVLREIRGQWVLMESQELWERLVLQVLLGLRDRMDRLEYKVLLGRLVFQVWQEWMVKWGCPETKVLPERRANREHLVPEVLWVWLVQEEARETRGQEVHGEKKGNRVLLELMGHVEKLACLERKGRREIGVQWEKKDLRDQRVMLDSED